MVTIEINVTEVPWLTLFSPILKDWDERFDTATVTLPDNVNCAWNKRDEWTFTTDELEDVLHTFIMGESFLDTYSEFAVLCIYSGQYWRLENFDEHRNYGATQSFSLEIFEMLSIIASELVQRTKCTTHLSTLESTERAKWQGVANTFRASARLVESIQLVSK